MGQSLKATDFFNGYIVTKNGIRLTGMIGTVNQTWDESSVIFINDFGNIYQIFPQLVKGFAFQRDTSVVFFESKIEKYEKRWVFMEVLCKGQGYNLYTAQSERTMSIISPYETKQRVFQTSDFYLESEGKIPFKIHRIGFRKQLRRLFQRQAPELAAKIGQKGYRYKNIVEIIEAYNEIIINKPKKFL